MMNAMIGGRDDDPLQEADVDVEVGVFPKLDQQPKRVTNAGFGGTEFAQAYRDNDLGDVVDERMEEAGAEPGEPIHLLNGMMPGMRAPKQIEAMLPPVNPINDEVHHEERQND